MFVLRSPTLTLSRQHETKWRSGPFQRWILVHFTVKLHTSYPSGQDALLHIQLPRALVAVRTSTVHDKIWNPS